MTELTVEQLRDELTQMQLDANAVCQSLGVKWAADGNYPSFAVQAVGALRGRAARGEWQRDEAQAELAQARIELKDLRGANREYGRQLAHLTSNRNFWFGECLAAERERDQIRKEAQEQSELVQRDWLSPAEAEGLRRQLKDAEARRQYWYREARDDEVETKGLRRQLADARRVARLWFRRARGLWVEVEIEGKEMIEALQDERKLRLMAERSAEALEHERDEWRMSWENVTADLLNTRKRLAEAELAAHVHGKSLDEMAQTVRTERALRQEAEQNYKAALLLAADREARMDMAEQRAERAEVELERGHRTLTTLGVPPDDGNDRLVMRIEQMLRNERARCAERAEALAASTREAVEWLWGFWDGNTLVARIGYGDSIREAWDRLLAATDGEATVNLLGRLEEAEALAALVTPKLASLLERLKAYTYTVAADYKGLPEFWAATRDAGEARKLAAQIREALDEH